VRAAASRSLSATRPSEAAAPRAAAAKAQLSELKDASEGFAKMENAYKVQLGALESRVSDLKQRLAEKERAGGDGASKAKVRSPAAHRHLRSSSWGGGSAHTLGAARAGRPTAEGGANGNQGA
jgi:hypothetical protein